ncbi:hypothetical protein [Haloferax volcanii]|uniref:Uncharacterized protein n=1 Tax=Haloferax volcanii TaxID=2246 RepID=A0A558GCT7_HALVO|nr:hypothetical protein [Haloferax volcanii]TVT95592.1 hypothetical protein FQA18_05750 [Haloferax volcanii]
MKELADVSDDELRAAGHFLNDESYPSRYTILLDKDVVILKVREENEYETDDVTKSHNITYKKKWWHGREEVLEEIERREIEL